MKRSMLFFIFFLSTFTVLAQSGEAPQRAPKMMEAVKADEVAPPHPAKGPKKEKGSEMPSIPKKSDWEYYQKSGDRALEWDDLVQSGFESFDSSSFATASIFLQKAYAKGCRDGLLLLKLGLYEESRQHFKEAMEYLVPAAEKFPKQYPHHPGATHIGEHAGRILYHVGQYDRALPFLESALASDSENFMLLFMTGQILKTQKKYLEAIHRFEKALTVAFPVDLQPNPKKIVLTELMALTYSMKNLDACLSYAEQVLILVPDDPAALAYRDKIQKQRFNEREREAIEKIVH